MLDSVQTSHHQEAEERAALDGALIALGLAPDNTCTCAELKARISKLPHAVLGLQVGTTPREVHTAYLRKAKEFHSDKKLAQLSYRKESTKSRLSL